MHMVRVSQGVFILWTVISGTARWLCERTLPKVAQ
jgi:hypothetical protein